MSSSHLKEFLASHNPDASAERGELVASLLQTSRRMGTRSVLFHAAVAERLGLNPSDHKCADLISHETGPITAGRLAELTGLSSGAITGVVDRLERAGFVSRVPDAEDRRRVLIKGNDQRLPDAWRLYAPMVRAMADACTNYSDEQLGLIADFMQRCAQVLETQIQHLQPHEAPQPSAEPAQKSARPRTDPLKLPLPEY